MKIKSVPYKIWWELGINPEDPADWALMSGLENQIIEKLQWDYDHQIKPKEQS